MCLMPLPLASSFVVVKERSDLAQVATAAIPPPVPAVVLELLPGVAELVELAGLVALVVLGRVEDWAACEPLVVFDSQAVDVSSTASAAAPSPWAFKALRV